MQKTTSTISCHCSLETFFYTNPAPITIGEDRNKIIKEASVKTDETIIIDANVCLKKEGDTGTRGQDALMQIRLNHSINAVEASFSNRESTKDDSECASLKWVGTVTADTDVALVISGSRVNTNDVIISTKQLSVSWSIFDTDYLDHNSQ